METSMTDNDKAPAQGQAQDAPQVFVCPISLQIMRDPVVVLATGQVYDRKCIQGWFDSGHSTCPATGVELTDRSVARLHSLRRSIERWLVDSKCGDQVAPLLTAYSKRSSRSLDAFCKDVSGQSSNETFQVYNCKRLSNVVRAQNTRTWERTSALELLIEMLRHGYASTQALRDDFPKGQVWSLTSGMRPGLAAELEFNLYKHEMRENEILKFLRWVTVGKDNWVLKGDVLQWFSHHSGGRRGRLKKAGEILAETGAEDVLEDMLLLGDVSIGESPAVKEAKEGAAFVILSLLFNPNTRSLTTKLQLTRSLIYNFLTTENVSLKYCIVKGLQYTCGTPEGRTAFLDAGCLQHIVQLLPPLNDKINHHIRVFKEWYVRVTLVETVVKLMSLVSQNQQGLCELLSLNVLPALQNIAWRFNVGETCRTEHLEPLIKRLMSSYYGIFSSSVE